MHAAEMASFKRDQNPASRLGFWAAIVTTVLAIGTFSLAVSAIPISGPWCQGDCVSYPYADVAANVPHDYLWMVPAILMELVFVVLIVCVHQSAAIRHKLYSQIAVAFTVMSAAILAADYYIQFAVMQPSIMREEWEGFALLTQYNPHGVFIALEEIGYLLMSLGFFFAAPVFAGRNWNQRLLRWLFAAAGIMTVGGWIAYYAAYGMGMEYRFEIYAISVNWLALAIGGGLLSRWFLRSATSVQS